MLKTLDQAASNLRGKLGESVASLQKFVTPLEQATTSSLEALQAFSLGQAAHGKADDENAIPSLKRAVELDPNFAMAYATLGIAYGNLAQTSLSTETCAKRTNWCRLCQRAPAALYFCSLLRRVHARLEQGHRNLRGMEKTYPAIPFRLITPPWHIAPSVSSTKLCSMPARLTNWIQKTHLQPRIWPALIWA